MAEQGIMSTIEHTERIQKIAYGMMQDTPSHPNFWERTNITSFFT